MSAPPPHPRAAWIGLLIALAILSALAVVAWRWHRNSGSAGPLADRLGIGYEERLDLTRADRVWRLGDLAVRVAMSRPARPLEPIEFRLQISRGDRPLTGLRPALSFNMDMDMGPLSIELAEAPEGYRGQAVLPACLRGGKRWYARLRFELDARPVEQPFLFDLQ
jgi:hypothetical protein